MALAQNTQATITPLLCPKTEVINQERKECTFTWFIENYSYCLQKNTEALSSPDFFVSGLKSSVWRIQLYPRGSDTDRKGYISLFLQRSKLDDGPKVIWLKYELSLLGKDGSAVISKELRHTFGNGDHCGHVNFLLMLELFLLHQDTLLPRDTLTVRCKLWFKEEDIHMGQRFARTRIAIEHVSFLHVVEGFQRFEKFEKKTTRIRYSTKDKGVTSVISLINSLSDDKGIIFEISPSRTEEILLKCKLFLLGASGILTKCGEEDYRADPAREEISSFLLSLTKKNILEKKEEYLSDGKLTLLCQCTFSTGVKYKRIENNLHEIPSSVLHETNKDLMTEKMFVRLRKLRSVCHTILPYDVELKTKTKSFHAHKILLCVTSLVFKDMLTKDVGRMSTVIQIYDLDDDTVGKLLYFLYFGDREYLQWDSAIKLYHAANAYAIKELKSICSSFLIDNLSISNAYELLFQAQTHKDSYLEIAVKDFIQINRNKFMVQTNGKN